MSNRRRRAVSTLILLSLSCQTMPTTAQSDSPTPAPAVVCTVDSLGAPIGPPCDSGDFCQLVSGICQTFAAQFSGTCQARPDPCSSNSSPVCGCDGNDYANECEAHSAGVNVAYEGGCITTEEPTASPETDVS